MNFLPKIIRSIETDNRQTARLAFAFVVFVFVFESYKLGINYSEYLIYLADSQEILFGLAAILFIILSLIVFYIFTVVSFSSQPAYKFGYWVLFTVAAIVEFGYQKALGRFSAPTDIETAIATTPEQQLASISLYANLAALVPCAIFLLCLVFLKNEEPRGLKTFLRTFALFALFFGGLSTIGGFFIEKKFPTVSLNAFCRTSADFLISGPISNGGWVSNSGQNQIRRQVKPPALPDDFRPSNNILLIIDESVRGDHFSLNGYARKTTPLLDDLKNRRILHNWGIAVAASTGSRYSYNALMLGLTPDAFPDKTEFKISTFPTLFQYAKAMKYETFYFDGQMKNYWGGVADDKNYIDHIFNVNFFDDKGIAPKWEIDNRIAVKINQLIGSRTGMFIVVFKYGSHIPYQDSFPPDQAVWQPSYSTKNKFDIPAGEQLAEVVNSYDNAIRYNVNSFFANLIKDYSNIPNNTTILYTGDHGQSLFVNGRSSHGGSTIAEANVPLFVIGKLESEPDLKYKASHQNIFPTILDLFNYPEELRESGKSRSLLKAKASDSRPRFFNPDLDVKVPFD